MKFHKGLLTLLYDMERNMVHKTDVTTLQGYIHCISGLHFFYFELLRHVESDFQ